MTMSSGGRQRGRLIRVLQILGVGLVLAGATSIAAAATQRTIHPLDAYPGFGRSSDAVLRDNAIAYWEALRREQLVESCMVESGFSYVADVAFPSEAMLAVAAGLDIGPSPAFGLVPPSETNRAHESGLSPSERDRYFMALFGESAADIAKANRTGQVPSGRADGFADGGCTGKAAVMVGSIWDLRRSLATEYADLHRATFNSPELVKARDAFRLCTEDVGAVALDDPAALDQLAVDGQIDPSSASAIRVGCEATWDTAYRLVSADAARKFVQEHQVALRSAEERYRHAMESIRADKDFHAYLSEQVALAPDPIRD